MKNIITGLLCLFSALLTANEYFVCRVPKLEKAIIIDGKIQADEYKNAARLPAFNNSTGLFSPRKQELYLAYDKENLYVAFRTDIEWAAAFKPIAFDDLNIWTVDSLDIALIPDRTKPYDIVRFITERAGGYADMKAKGQVKQPPEQWNPMWKRASRLTAQSYMSAYTWELEVAIPWQSLNLAEPKPGTVIPAQFLYCFGDIRKDVNGNPDRVVTWAPVPKGRDWVNPRDFGELHFAGEKPVFQADREPVFGVKGNCTAPIKGNLSGLLWEIGKSGQPLRTAKKIPTNGININWPEKVNTNKTFNSMMYWRLTDEFGTVAAGRYTTTLEPAFKVTSAVNHQQRKIITIGDVSDLNLKNDHFADIILKDKQNKVIHKKSVTVNKKYSRFELNFDISKISTPAEVLLQATLRDAKNTTKFTFNDKLDILNRPAWMNADYLGKVTEPPPMWHTPEISQKDGKIKITVNNNSYIFGSESLLPEKVFLRNKLFSDGNFMFEAITTSGVQHFKNSAAPVILQKDARGATLLLKGTSAELEITARVRVEFDGMAYYTTEIKPLKKNVKIHKLAIIMPLDASQLRYMRANNAMNVRELVFNSALIAGAKSAVDLPEPDMQFAINFSGRGWKFGDIFHNFYWIGGEDRGIFFALPSSQNMSVKKYYSATAETEKSFKAEFVLIDNTKEIKNTLDYEFAFFLTPTKKLANRAKLRRAGSGFVGNVDSENAQVSLKPRTAIFGGNARNRFFYDKELRKFEKDDVFTLLLPCWKLRTIQSGNPMPPANEIAYIDKWLKNHKNTLGTTQMLWYDAFFTPFQLKETAKYLIEFESWPITRLPVEQHGTYVCPVQTWQNFYLTGVNDRIKQGVDSFYMDLTFLKPCSNRFHGCGYRDENGVIHGKVPLLEAREMFLRYQNIVKKNNPDGILYLHGYSATPLSLWVDVITSGEEWLTAPNYKTLTPEYFQSILYATDALGTASNFFPGGILMHYIQAQKNTATLSEMCGLSFVHGESMWNGTEAMMPGLRMVWDALDKFNIDNAEWVPYWRNPDSPADRKILISSWERDNEKLMILFNTSYQAETVILNNYSDIQDTLDNDKNVPSQINMPPRTSRLLKVKRK